MDQRHTETLESQRLVWDTYKWNQPFFLAELEDLIKGVELNYVIPEDNSKLTIGLEKQPDNLINHARRGGKRPILGLYLEMETDKKNNYIAFAKFDENSYKCTPQRSQTSDKLEFTDWHRQTEEIPEKPTKYARESTTISLIPHEAIDLMVMVKINKKI